MAHRIIVIVGPTATGKTGLAIKLAEKIRGEIISADSMQAYKCMDILSQKPTKLQESRVKHHLVSFLNPSSEYSAAAFSRMAGEKARDMTERGKAPIVAGGSGLYVKAFVDGIFPSKGKDKGIRRRLRRLVGEKGALFLYRRLEKIDPASAERIHPNDLKRLMRALEIHELERETKTSLKKKTKGVKDEYDVKIFGLVMDRVELYDRIERRVDLMFQKGLVREVKGLLRRKLSVTSRQALGIKEIKGYLNGKYDIEKAKEILKRNTRRFAKRQLTWFRADKRIVWLDVGKMTEKQAIDIMVNG